ncbi:MAG: MFS transporter [Chthoniobacterales bacterium]|nr:MAG: MFS transporter [Chthoniobacterales bacterium]
MTSSDPQPKTGARTALSLLLGINLFNYIDRYILAAVEPEIRHTFFAADDIDAKAKTGTLATAFLVSYMISAPIFGRLADRWSRWFLIGGGVAVWSLASGATGFAGSFLILLVTRIFVGIGEGAYGPAAPTILADLYPLQIRGRIMAVFFMAIPVGSALGYAFGGWANGHFGWRWAFYLVMPPGLLLAVLCMFMREPRDAEARRLAKSQRKSRRADLAVLFRTRSYVLNTLASAAMTFAIGGIAFWTPTYIYEYRGQADLGRINMIFGALTVVAGIFATLLGGWAGDKLRPRFAGSYFLVSGIGMVIAFPFILGMLFLPFPWAWVAIFFAVFFLFLNTGPANTALANVTHPSIRATGFAFNILIIHALGDAISPPLIGAIAGRTNMNVAFVVVSATVLLSGLLWLRGMKYLPADTAAVEIAAESRLA